MLDRLRTSAFSLLASKRGNRLGPVRVGKKLALYLNDVAGRPLADEAELRRRAELELGRGASMRAVQPSRPEPAPAVVFHVDQGRELHAMKALLDDAGVSYQLRDIAFDEAARSAVHRDGGGQRLPLLFVAGTAVGGVNAVRRLCETGEIKELLGVTDSDAPQDELASESEQSLPCAATVEVYGDDTCGWTARSIALLEREGVDFCYIDLRAPNAPATRDQLERATGARTQPFVFVRGEFVGGYNSLDKLARLGQLGEPPGE